MNNRVPPGSNEGDVYKILSLVEQTIFYNDGERYTDPMFYFAAEKVYQNKLRELETKCYKQLTEMELREQIRKEAEEQDGILVTFAKGIQITTTKVKKLFKGDSN
ncbi:hypothetical protein SNE40_005993 [Patella caerulea]|uniref:Uncharacterized protein n=1 Tax=Patella caerulea TaxID=87958 RepID=A0AAN8K1N6_PATCE